MQQRQWNITLTKVASKRSEMITTELEGNIADVQDSYKYFGVSRANANHEGQGHKEVSHNQVPPKSKAGPEGSAKQEEQSPSRQHVCPASYQIPCWYNYSDKAGDRSHWYQDKACHNARRVSPEVQNTKMKDSRLRTSESLLLSRINNKDPKLSEWLGLLKTCERGGGASRKDKLLQGMDPWQVEEVADIEKSCQWQEKVRGNHAGQEPRCRLCKAKPKTVQHIIAGCKMQTGMTCVDRFNQAVYKNICAKYGSEVQK